MKDGVMQRDVLALHIEEALEKLPADADVKQLSYTARREDVAPSLYIEHDHLDSGGKLVTVTLDDTPVVTGQHAQEVLHHFSCGSCEKRWAIDNAQLELGKVLICPHCGTKQTFEDEVVM